MCVCGDCVKASGDRKAGEQREGEKEARKSINMEKEKETKNEQEK